MQPLFARVHALFEAVETKVCSGSTAPLTAPCKAGNLERELADAQQLTEAFLECTCAGTPGPQCATQVDPTYNGWKNAPTP